jgi:hypothetical protein
MRDIGIHTPITLVLSRSVGGGSFFDNSSKSGSRNEFKYCEARFIIRNSINSTKTPKIKSPIASINSIARINEKLCLILEIFFLKDSKDYEFSFC